MPSVTSSNPNPNLNPDPAITWVSRGLSHHNRHTPHLSPSQRFLGQRIEGCQLRAQEETTRKWLLLLSICALCSVCVCVGAFVVSCDPKTTDVFEKAASVTLNLNVAYSCGTPVTPPWLAVVILILKNIYIKSRTFLFLS